MRPFLRAPGRARLAPAGWVSEPAGVWDGRLVEVVYDPHRHQVLFVRNSRSDELAFVDAGFRQVAVDGEQGMWVRDLVAETEARLDRLERHPSLPARGRHQHPDC